MCFFISTHILEATNWQSVLLYPALLIGLLVAILLYFTNISNRLRCSREDNSNISFLSNTKAIFYNPLITLLLISNFFMYITGFGLAHWSTLLIISNNKHSFISACLTSGGFEIMGTFGVLSSVVISRVFFKSNHSFVCCIFLFLTSILLLIFMILQELNLGLATFVPLIIGFLIFAPQSLMALVVIKFSKNSYLGTINGYLSIVGYLGSTIAGIGGAKLAEAYGWGCVCIFLSVSSAISAGGFYLISQKEKKHFDAIKSS